MPPPKKDQLVVVDVTKAPKHIAASAKMRLAEKILSRTDDLEDVLQALLRIVRGDGSPKEQIEAAKILLANSVGEPVKTQINAEVDAKHAGLGSGVSRMSSEQLAEVATAKALPAEPVTDAVFTESLGDTEV